MTRRLSMISPTRTTETLPPDPNKYIAVFLDSVQILDNSDSGGPGEIEIFSGASTGDKVQNARFPVKQWHEAPNGTIISVNLPIFCLPEDQMGDGLRLFMMAWDDDDVQNWKEWAVENVPSWFSINGQSIAPNPDQDPTNYLKSMREQAADFIGVYDYTYTREENWGAGPDIGKVYWAHNRNAVFSYRILYTEALNRPVEVRLNPIDIYENGDSFDAEIYVWTRVADFFNGNVLGEVISRFPSSGTTSKSDNDVLGENWQPEWKVIFDTPEAGPFLYWEVGVWDEDNPSLLDNHDMLGIYSGYTFFGNSYGQTGLSKEEAGSYWAGGRVNGTKGDCDIGLQIIIK